MLHVRVDKERMPLEQHPQEILKDIIFMYYIKQGYESQNAERATTQLFKILRDPPPPGHDVSWIQSFMEITEWDKFFVNQPPSLIKSCRAIQKLYRELHPKQRYGMGDLNTCCTANPQALYHRTGSHAYPASLIHEPMKYLCRI